LNFRVNASHRSLRISSNKRFNTVFHSRNMLSICIFTLTVSCNALRMTSTSKSAHSNNFDCDSGFTAPYGTNCPNARWTDLMVLSDASPDKVIVNVGCNKGNDMIEWMERWDTSATFNTDDWIKYFKAEGITKYACPPTSPAQRTKASTKGLSQKLPVGVCVEAMKGNVDMLEKAASAMGYSGHANASLHIIHAAAVEQHSPAEMVNFPDGELGKETGRLPVFVQSLSPTPLKTVDEIVSDCNLPRVDILSIDTEGWDSDVLLGSVKTLPSVRYLEFEVHRDFKKSPWSKTTVKAVTDNLNNMGFDCFWAGNNGKLLSINACYTETMETGHWSNVACVRRGDVWWKDLQQFAIHK